MLVSRGWLKSCVSKFWVAQNCARKFRVTILLRDPLTIPGYISDKIQMWLLTCCSSIARTVVPGARPLVEVVPAVNNVSSPVSRVTCNTCHVYHV